MSSKIKGLPAGFSDEEEEDGEDEQEDSFITFRDLKSQDDTVTSTDYVELNYDDLPLNSDPIIEDESEDFRYALKHGDLETVREMITNGDMTPDYSFNGGWTTPIRIVCEYGYPEILRYLLSLDVSILKMNDDSFTPLMAIASSSESKRSLIDCAQILIDNGVDVNAKQSQGMTALMMVSKTGYYELAEFLIRNGADSNARDCRSWNSLCYAADHGQGAVARLLLEHGADPDTPTSDGLLPVDYASLRENKNLQDVIERFSKTKSLIQTWKPRLFSNTTTTSTFDELDKTIMKLDLGDKVRTLFEKHRIGYKQFLTLTESDLEEIGITSVGIRKRISSHIAEIHRRHWKRSNLTTIQKNNDELTCLDAVTMVANVSEQLEYIQSNASYLRKKLERNPGILENGRDVADYRVFDRFLRICISECRSTTTEMEKLRRTLTRIVSRGTNYEPAD